MGRHLYALPLDADQWQALFQSWIPEWTNSLAGASARRAGGAMSGGHRVPSSSPSGRAPPKIRWPSGVR
jgi:hypothetical protein